MRKMRKFSTAISSCVSGTGRCMNLGRRFGILREKIFGRGGSLTGTDTFATDSLSSAAEAGGASSSTDSPDEEGTFSSPSAAAASARPSGGRKRFRHIRYFIQRDGIRIKHLRHLLGARLFARV